MSVYIAKWIIKPSPHMTACLPIPKAAARIHDVRKNQRITRSPTSNRTRYPIMSSEGLPLVSSLYRLRLEAMKHMEGEMHRNYNLYIRSDHNKQHKMYTDIKIHESKVKENPILRLHVVNPETKVQGCSERMRQNIAPIGGVFPCEAPFSFTVTSGWVIRGFNKGSL